MLGYDITVTSELYMNVDKYLKGSVSLNQFEDWFYSNLAYFLALPQSNELFLANEIMLGLAELSNKDISESEFKENITSLVERGSFAIFGNTATIIISSGAGASDTIRSGNYVSDNSPLPVPV